MRLLARNRLVFDRLVDAAYSPEQSIVLRYRNVFCFETTEKDDAEYKKQLQKTSIGEGARIVPLLVHRGVNIYALDETSLMHTKTLKSIDGCVTAAKCRLGGHDKVVFASGGNTGTALTAYGRASDIETFFFIPEANLFLLDSGMFSSSTAHLISVEEPRLAKQAAHLFLTLNKLKCVPERDWRYQASMFRGLFLLEYFMQYEKFDWLTQTMSAAFGPIGIYRVLQAFRNEIGDLPKFLGVQQEANCPMYRAWKTDKENARLHESNSAEQLLSRVMCDEEPQTYGTYKDFEKLLMASNGNMTTVNHAEFADFLERRFDGEGILKLLRDVEIEITVNGGEVVEKTGLISLAGTIKEIDKGRIAKGSKVLWCLTGGICEADGKAEPEYKITVLDALETQINEYSRFVFGS